MDGGSGLNIIFAEILDAMGVSRDKIRPVVEPFHGIVPGKEANPIWHIDLPVTFGNPMNFCTETITLEVVDFHGAYHAILGRPCYAKFMAVPNYTYLKLMMPGPKGMITVSASYQHTYECDTAAANLALAMILQVELADLNASVAEERLDSNEKAASAFQAAEDSKEIHLDPTNEPSKVARIGTALSPK